MTTNLPHCRITLPPFGRNTHDCAAGYCAATFLYIPCNWFDRVGADQHAANLLADSPKVADFEERDRPRSVGLATKIAATKPTLAEILRDRIRRLAVLFSSAVS